MANSTAPTPHPDQTFIVRPHNPKDLYWVVSRHGTLYAKEYNWDIRFENLVSQIANDFQSFHDPTRERCWIAEDATGHSVNSHRITKQSQHLEHETSNLLGCIMLVCDRDAPDTAKLRLLLVEPKARGRGVGRALIRECVGFAKEVGYRRIVLWTQHVLESARRLYRAEGFRLVKEEEHETFGVRLVGEEWELML